MPNSILDTVLLFSLPASGKSETRTYMASLTPEQCVQEMAMGPTVQLDDYPYVHLMHRIDEEIGLYIVADGMGGHAAGEVASQEAVDTIYGMVKRGMKELRELHDPIEDSEARAVCRLLESAVQAATYMVFSVSKQDVPL